MSARMPGMEAVAAGADWIPHRGRDAGRAVRAAGAAILAMLATLPAWKLLARPETGVAGEATVEMTAAYSSFVWSGMLVLLIPAILIARSVSPAQLETAARVANRALTALPGRAWAVLIALSAFLLASLFSTLVLRGQPNLIDAMTQLVHARYVAAGRLAGPGAELGAFWQAQHSLFTEHGWVSQYPPGHIMVLAAAMKLNAAWAVGPLMLATTVLFTTLAAERLLPGRPAIARLGGFLVAISPFMIAHAGAYMNHTTAAAFCAIALFCTVRAKESAWWSAGAGAALGAMFATRPLSALTVAVPLAIWQIFSQSGNTSRGASSPTAAHGSFAFAAGAAPIVAAVALFNAHFFGAPQTFGYTAALGDASGLGFGADPWGNAYGPAQALAYTSAELTSLSLFLLETPIPVVALVAVWLMFERRIQAGERLLIALATLPLLAQSLYWHHGLFMGPRMLNETAPAWCLLGVIAGEWAVRTAPARARVLSNYSPRLLIAVMLTGAVLTGALLFGPLRLASYRQRPMALEVAAQATEPALVFVHGGWTSRLVMRLAAAGMRLDSVETAIRQNPTCAVQQYATAREAGAPLPVLDLSPRAFPLPPSVAISEGNRIRILPGEKLKGECARQAIADRLGTIDVTPLLWRGDLPGVNGNGTMFVRDLGPAMNLAMIEAYPERRPYVMMTDGPEMKPVLAEYAAGMERLWGQAGGGE